MNLIFTLFTRTYIKNLSSETYEDAGKEHWIQHKIVAPDEVAAQVSFKLQHPHLEICGCEQETMQEWLNRPAVKYIPPSST